MWKIVLASAFLMAIPQTALAQDESEGVAPKTFTVHGGAEGVAQGFLAYMRLQRFQRDQCWKMGCLVIVNETRGYDVIGFYIEGLRSKQGKSWGRNLFEVALSPRKAALAYKDGGASACDHPVRFELRHRVTKERLTVDGTASLCSTPHTDSLLRIKVLEPQVIWDDEPGAETPKP
ncbi:MAG: hypothetical protein EOP61_14115 [Sphingomonadales bacterium]|nr:MAG: hypothetical protein EOP61_14115 [Sphingomonadales bacterium]